MRKAARLFEVIQILRQARRPVTAATIAAELEVTVRSVYRDIAALQAMRVPIEGARGLGYVLRPGFDLPPLMFTIEETEAVVLALALLERTGDADMVAAARRVAGKIAGAVPAPLKATLERRALYAWGGGLPASVGDDAAEIRRAIRVEEKLALTYRDETGTATERVVRPLALIYYANTLVLVAWCELRDAIRNFRVDRIDDLAATTTFFRGEGDRLRARWVAGWNTATGTA
jgi:predicted DNA-binding transcriptional regulator YafY